MDNKKKSCQFARRHSLLDIYICISTYILQCPQCGSRRSALWPACRDKNYEENNVNVGDDIVDGADDIGATLCGR